MLKMSITFDELPELTDKGLKCPFCDHIIPKKKFNKRKFIKLAKELQEIDSSSDK